MRRVRQALVVVWWLAAISPAQAVEPPGELGKVTRRHEGRVIGREERDNSFRGPGSILAEAKADRPQVPPDQLAGRQRAMYRGQSFTQSLPGSPVGRAAPGGEDRPPTRTANTTAAPLTAAHYAVIASAVGLLLVLTGCIVRRRVAHPARARSAAALSPSAGRPRGGRGRRHPWLDRELNITMGHRP